MCRLDFVTLRFSLTEYRDFLPINTLITLTLPLTQDTLTTGSAAGLKWAANSSNGYTYLRVEASCLKQAPATPSNPALTVGKLVQMWSKERNDSFIVEEGGKYHAHHTHAHGQ